MLFEILSEEISLFTATQIIWEEREKYTDYEMEKSLFRRYLMHSTETILSRLIQVVDKLKSDIRYEKYHYLLPDIEFDDDRGRQKHFELDLTGANKLRLLNFLISVSVLSFDDAGSKRLLAYICG